MTLGRRHLEAFSAVVETLLPAVDGPHPAWTMSGNQPGTGERLSALYESLPQDRQRQELRIILSLLGSRVAGTLLFGRPGSFVAMAPADRSTAFRSMETNPVETVRKAARALKTLAAYIWVTSDDPSLRPSSWDAMGYPGPDGPPPDVPKAIETTEVRADTTLDCDVVVVGSGAGGGVAAGVLAGAGLSVVVLEKGGYHNEADFSHLEADAYRSMYLDGALGTTSDGGMAMLAGSTLGGGTVINYTTSFPTPNNVREEWDRLGHFDGVFAGESFERATSAVTTRMGVNRDNCFPSARDRIMEKGLRGMGWHVVEMPRNAVDCTETDCGYCTMGCRIGAKRSTLATWLVDAFTAGARIVTGADVRYVETEGGGTVGVVAAAGEHLVRVRSKAVVLAAGALSTPAILLRSGLGGPVAGRHLHLHPVTAVWGRFDERVDPWSGVLQARYSDQFADLDGHGHGFKLETAPVHPLFPAAFLGWEDGVSFKRDVLGLGHLAVAGILLRDRDHGRVTVRRDGSAVWRYRISRSDQAHIREGVLRGAQVLAEAGATEVLSSTVRPVRWRPSDAPAERFRDAVDSVGYGPNRTAYFSFHQMGSARMGADPATSVVGADNQAHDTPGLYVMDGSCFPNASGVNPMLSIAAIAHRGATQLSERLA